MLDLIPPAALLTLNAAVGAVLCVRWRRERTERPLGTSGGGALDGPLGALTVAYVAAPALFGLGGVLFVLLGRWRPGIALGALGTLVVPAALAWALQRARLARALVLALAAVTWVVAWVPELRPVDGWTVRHTELCYAGYVTVALAISIHGAWSSPRRPDRGRSGRRHAAGERGVEGGAPDPASGREAQGAGARTPDLAGTWADERRVLLCGLPFLLTGVVYLLVAGDGARRPVFSTSLHAGAQVMLLALVGRGVRRVPAATLPSLALQALLLATGALLLLVIAANLRLFPREPAPLIVATLVATGLAVAYGLLRPALDAILREALYPEVRRAEERLRALQGELVATRGRLTRAEQLGLVGQLAAQVAHEIKNPLGPIRGYTKVIEREAERAGALNEVIARGLRVIREEVEAIDARARGLLELARPPEPELAPVDYARLVQDVLDLQASDRPPGVRLVWASPPPTGAAGQADPVLLKGALANVFQNALQAVGRVGGGAVSVALEPSEGERWRLIVDDDGPGLPVADAEELFRPFVSHGPGGCGLGLAIARGSLRALGGDLTLAARPEGGTRATLALPAPGRRTGAPAEPRPPMPVDLRQAKPG